MQTDPDTDPSALLAPFDSSLPLALRLAGERSLLESRGLTRDTYSTQRFLADGPHGGRSTVKAIPVSNDNLLICEAPSPDLCRYCEERGLRLATDIDADRATELIETALLTVIEPLPFLWSAVSELTWRCHPLVASDEDYDVSFSDPAIPFSTFVSTPSHGDRKSILRVAEGIVHETMHLQLTLFERLSPLIDPENRWSMYSPWKREERSAHGVLHGLYVFYILGWMWRKIAKTSRSSIDQDFSCRRVSEIDQEIFAARGIQECSALTDAGRRFVHRLLGG